MIKQRWQGKANKAVLAMTIFVVVVLPALIALGFWQLNRAEEKAKLQAEYDARSQDKVVRIAGRVQALEALRYYKVEATGFYNTDYEILIDNRVQRGQVGYHVITPLRINNSDVHVLVNRGWIPQGRTREELPQIETTDGLQHVTGLAMVPLMNQFQLGETILESRRWQRVWQALDLELYQGLAPFPLQPVVVLMDPDNNALGFVRSWKRLDSGIAIHQGYAFQWFSLAAALLIIYAFVVVRAKRPFKQDSAEGH